MPSLAFATMPRFGVMLPSLFLIGAAYTLKEDSHVRVVSPADP